MKYLIVANWKMNPKSRKEVAQFIRLFKKGAGRIRNADVIIAPPFPYIPFIPKSGRYALGAQNLFWESEGSFTGEVSGNMLKEFGVRYAIVGHSERRRHLGETDEMVNKKLKQVLAIGIRPILCVGELKRDSEGAFFSFIKKQIESAFHRVKADDAPRVIIAYEPIWAIGTGRPARPEDAREASLFIKKTIASLYGLKTARKIRVLYGGSVDGKNAGAFLKEREVAGLLVGRESRHAEKFLAILQCIKNLS